MKKRSWLEKLSNGLDQWAGETVRQAVMQGSEQLTPATSPAKKAKWVKGAMDRLDALVDEPTRAQVLENCSCQSQGRIERARAIYRQSQDIDAFLEALQQQRIVGTKLTREGDRIYVFYDRCYCGMVNATQEKISPTFCQCSKNYVLKTFEGIFEKPVAVELIQSIIQGAPECKFVVHL